MKRFSFFCLLIIFTFNAMFGDDGNTQVIILQHTHGGGTHFSFPVPAIEPDVYYDSDAQQIIVEGTGNVSYYDVEITALSTFDVPISTRIDGTYDTIDVSSLPSDDYVITINTPMEISYQSKFTII